MISARIKTKSHESTQRGKPQPKGELTTEVRDFLKILFVRQEKWHPFDVHHDNRKDADATE
jgi:hypothetical protein